MGFGIFPSFSFLYVSKQPYLIVLHLSYNLLIYLQGDFLKNIGAESSAVSVIMSAFFFALSIAGKGHLSNIIRRLILMGQMSYGISHEYSHEYALLL